MIVFSSDVHLGLKTADPAEREQRFIAWLRSLALEKGDTLFLLGDIWDFWYEYKDVVPKCGFKVLAQLSSMIERGVEIYFVPGNHDIWCFSFFEEIGMHKVDPQPAVFEMEGVKFLVAHGDMVGGATLGMRVLHSIFHSRVCQALFSTLHPYFAFGLGRLWSTDTRTKHAPYVWKDSEERLWKYAASREPDIRYFIFGHYHTSVRQTLPSGARLVVLDDWIKGGTPSFTINAR